MTAGMKGKNYDAWEVNEADFPRSGTIEEQISFLANYGILAPSVHNIQPWLLEVNKNTLVITADEKLNLPEADPLGRGLQISLGCFTTNIATAAAKFGFKVECDWNEKRVKLTFRNSAAKPSNIKLSAITSRYSDKLPYKQLPLRLSDLKTIESVNPSYGCSLNLITDREKIELLADVHHRTVLDYAKKRSFFHELSHWLRPSDTTAEDGMPGFVVGMSARQSKLAPKLVRRVPVMVKMFAKKDSQSIVSSSAVAFITVRDNSAKQWFNAGRFYEEVALKAAELGLAMAPMAAMIEEPERLGKVSSKLGIKGKPQVFFRLGYSSHPPYHTPRRTNTLSAVSSMKTQADLLHSLKIDIKSQHIQIGDCLLHYTTSGKGQPVILLHGANIGLAQWYRNIADLSKHFKVYAIDMPGAGSSTKINFRKADFEKDFVHIIEEFVKQMKLKKVHIIGSSFGGWIALKLAIKHAAFVDKIVLANPLGFTSYMPLQFRPVSQYPFAFFLSKTALRPNPKNKNLEKFMRDVFYNKKLPIERAFIDYFYELSKSSHNVLFISRLAGLTGMRKELFLRDELHKINRPIMVVWGKEDPLMPFWSVKDNFKLIPGGEVNALARVGHMPPIESPVQFNKLTIEFLKR